MEASTTASGLEGVVVADTRLSAVNGRRRAWAARRRRARHRAAGVAGFEDVAALL
jgi:predicted amidohydrolase